MENVTSTQRALLDRLRAVDPEVQVRWHEQRGVAAVLQGRLLPAAEMSADPAEEPEAVLVRFLSKLGPLVGPEPWDGAVRYVGVDLSRNGHVRIRAMQVADGIPVHSATLLLFADRERGVFRVQSGLWREVAVPPLVRDDVPIDVEHRAEALQKRLDRTLRASPEGRRFAERRQREGFGDDRDAEAYFPATGQPEHWLYPTDEGLRHVFMLHAYQPISWLGVDGDPHTAIDVADLVVDLVTGRTLYSGARLGAWADVTVDGLSTLQENGTYITRPLFGVREDAGDRLLVNRQTTPNIITHDAGGTESYLETEFKTNADISRDADGHWDITTTSCSATDRRDSQQPETDGHFFAGQAMDYYDQLGWDGFDNGEWGTPCIVRVAAHIGMGANAYFWRYIENNRHYGYVAFYDGECSGTTLTYDFMAGDPAIVAHEFQHGVTYFGAVDSAGQPGYLQTSDWHRALHEGLSDAVAGLRTGTWVAPGLWPAGACRNNAPFRRIEYPRSNATKGSQTYCDHYDDRVAASAPYVNSTILSHAIYLAGEGGVHERPNRPAQLIPVVGAGHGPIGDIVHYAVTELFDNVPPNSDGGKTMIEAANLILDAAEHVTGSKRTCPYVMLRRAFYAVGLFPFDEAYQKTTYGGEACMLPWTVAWEHSQPYLGLPAYWYQSPDLFINNGNGAEYDADVGVENSLFARVRNIGDQPLTNVDVRFFFRAYGTNLPTSSTQWKPCQDSSGTDCALTISSLASGSMNFTDANNPPANQAVKWYLDPTEVVAGVDHFCVRAEISCTASNHDNDCVNAVQSNVSYTQPMTAALDFAFLVANRWKERIPLDLNVDVRSLPRNVTVSFRGPGSLATTRLDPGQELPLYWVVELPPEGLVLSEPPWDGSVKGTVRTPDIEAALDGVLTGVTKRRGPSPGRNALAIEGLLAGQVSRARARRPNRFSGPFEGVLDLQDGRLTGTWAPMPGPDGRAVATLEVDAVLRPTRAVHFTQRVHGAPVGGVTLALRWPD